MFSGIVEELGELKRISGRGTVSLIEVKAKKVLEDTRIGDSIALNGACLTVVRKENGSLFFEAIPQTLKTTNLGSLRMLEKVNLERSLKVGDRVSGHFVTGHVDSIGIIRKKIYRNGNLALEISVPGVFLRYCLAKGSIAVDGVSLTIVNKNAGSFTVFIIPHTLQNTTLAFKGPSSKVNVEFDVLAKK